MTSLFQVFVDKENAEPLGVHPKGKSSGHGHLAKTFQSQHLTTPRKALGDVNRDLQNNPNTPAAQQKPVLKSKHTGVPQLKFKETDVFKKPISQPRGQLSGRSCNIQEARVGATKKQKTSVQMLSEERENMYTCNDIEDDYEDILPKKERISNYIDKLLSWRPPCLVAEDESEEDNDEHVQQIIASLENLPLPKSVAIGIEEQTNLEDLFDHSFLEDVELPNVDTIPDTVHLDHLSSIDILQLHLKSD